MSFFNGTPFIDTMPMTNFTTLPYACSTFTQPTCGINSLFYAQMAMLGHCGSLFPSSYSGPTISPGLDSCFYNSSLPFDSGICSDFYIQPPSPFSPGNPFSFGNTSSFNFNPLSFMGFNPLSFYNPSGRTRSHNKGNNTYKPLSDNCKNQIKDMASELKMSPGDIQAVIYAESRGNPKAVNPKSDATGLIQWLPDTAKEFGTSTDQLYKMSAEEQMPYVKAYLRIAKTRAGFKENENINTGTLYALVLGGPGRAKKDIIYTKADGNKYSQNSGLDFDNDGKITKTELTNQLNKMKQTYKIS